MISAPPQTPNYAQGFARQRGDSACPELWDGLVGLWAPLLGPTGGTLLDWSGRGNHGVLTNMDPATDWVTGPRGWALDFDGSNDTVPTTKVFPATTTDFTIISLASYATGGRYLVSQWQSSQGIMLQKATDNLQVYRDGIIELSAVYATAGVWHSLAVTFSQDSGWLLFGDGRILDASANTIYPNFTSEIPFRISDREDGLRAWKGQLAQTAVWQRALTPPEISRLSADPYTLLHLRPRVSSIMRAIGGPYHVTVGQMFHAGAAEGELFSTGSIIGECDGRSG